MTEPRTALNEIAKALEVQRDALNLVLEAAPTNEIADALVILSRTIVAVRRAMFEAPQRFYGRDCDA